MKEFTKEDMLNIFFLLSKAVKLNVIDRKTYNFAVSELKDYEDQRKQFNTELPSGSEVKESK